MKRAGKIRRACFTGYFLTFNLLTFEISIRLIQFDFLS